MEYEKQIMGLIIAITIIQIAILGTFYYNLGNTNRVVYQHQDQTLRATELIDDISKAVVALNKKIDDHQIQRYYAWIEANDITNADFEKVPMCVYETWGQELNVFLIGHDFVRYSLGKNYHLTFFSDKSFQCYEIFTESVIDCVSTCKTTNSTQKDTNL